jgi:hypothetical protein
VLLSAMSFLVPSAGAGTFAAGLEPVDTCFVAPPEDVAVEIGFYQCGYVVVPENPDRADSPEIRLGYLRMRARAAEPRAPFFMLAGGPGSTFIKPETLYLFNDAFLGPILDERDVVLLDQRGAPNAIPFLDCPEVYGLPWEVQDRALDEAASLALARELLSDCVQSARIVGIDLAQYNSLRIAADLDAARRGLGSGPIDWVEAARPA